MLSSIIGILMFHAGFLSFEKEEVFVHFSEIHASDLSKREPIFSLVQTMSKKANANSASYSPLKILVPIDGSPNADRASDVAIGLAKSFGSELLILNVISTPNVLITTSAFGAPASGLESYYEQQENSARHFVDEAVIHARKGGVSKVTSSVIRADKSIVEEIIGVASSNKVDLIVIGTRGLGGFKRLLLGSVSSGVVAHAHCNVLVVR
jgi:nucleotide-binding universal stress UspA family protein